MGRWLWQLGARHDVQRLTANLSHDNEHFIEDLEVFDGSNNQQTFANTSLAAGVTYRIAPAWAVAANLSQGYRAPSLYELYAGGSHSGVNAVQIGDPNLKAERALNIDLSLRYQTQPSQWQVTVYQKHIDNYIYLANTGLFRDKDHHYKECNPRDPSVGHGCIREMKAEQTNGVIQGLEMEWQQTWSANWHTYANLELISGRDRDNSRDLALIPANNALVELQYHFTQLSWQESAQVRFGVKAVAARKSPGDFEPFGQFGDEPIGVASTDAYSVWHLAYQTDWRVKGQTWQVTARVDNLFDTAYRDYLNTYKGFAQDLGRSVAVSARLSF
jgi:iron complex outermembrane receptor protein/hemoglobin/transferrin/lactoferrin receptor protein